MDDALQTDERSCEQRHAHALARALDVRRAGPLCDGRHSPSSLEYANWAVGSRSSGQGRCRVRCSCVGDGMLHWAMTCVFRDPARLEGPQGDMSEQKWRM